MTARTYDVILNVSDASNFSGRTTIFSESNTRGYISSVDTANNNIRVKLDNAQQEFKIGEQVSSTVSSLQFVYGSDIRSSYFQPKVYDSAIETATSTVVSIAPSAFIAEKNAFVQNPIVRLYSIYYPGEWYPPNEAGNPSNEGEGRAWPSEFPMRFAEIIGDYADDLLYNVSFNGTSYIPFPINMTSTETGSDGKINEASISIFNADDIVSNLIEDPFLSGNNVSNSVIATVNGELVHGIDPRTVDADPSDLGSSSSLAYQLLSRARSNGLFYSTEVVNYYKSANTSFDKFQTEQVGGTWRLDKQDSRDLLGGVVEVKTTFANFLDHWPEYSLIQAIEEEGVLVNNAIPYRVGDNVIAYNGRVEATITEILDNNFIKLSNQLDLGAARQQPLYIVNPEADYDNHIKDVFKIDQLESLNEHIANFSLVSWLHYFKAITPNRKYYKNTCQWKYKGDECQYPGPGGLRIPGTIKLSNAHPIAANNQIVADEIDDICSKSIEACRVRNNEIHFGGFPGVGRNVPVG